MATRNERVDLCVIGAGPAGLAAAERALELGASTAIVEAVEMGGVALNWGALPAHALAASARRAHDIRTAADLGIGAEDPRVNFARLNAHIKSVVEDARPNVSAERLAAKGAEVIRHPAAFTSPSTIAAGERRIKARRFILATGSRPHIPEIPGLEGVPFHTPETIFEITRRPAHLIVIGGGATGTTLAQAHRRLGCEVTLVDMLAPLGDEDVELAVPVLDGLEREGVAIFANTGVVAVEGDENNVVVTLRTGADERTISGSYLLVATGRSANLDTLDLGKARVKRGRGGVALDMVSRTSNHRIYCVGDAAGTRSVHAARFMGAWAATHALGPRLGLFLPPVLPRLIATDPEIAAVGLTEAQARARHGLNFSVTRFPLAGLDKARVHARREGHAKLLTTRRGRLVGAGFCGDGAGELAGLFGLVIAQRLTLHDLAGLLAPYPALSEIASLSAARYAADHPQSLAWRVMGTLKRLLP
ncbi:FAD-dependent oxidoreductase [Pelagibacterium limicola]|uniref:FAD-dependent oxidoreductase n=1 Tax=Pelagibacterium limicola TaxID=2791022 RepID=UPI0018AFFC96